MRCAPLVLLVLAACTGSGGGSNPPAAAPAPGTTPCPWAGTASSARADLGESANVSLLLVERAGKHTTVTVNAVVDSAPGVFTTGVQGMQLVLGPYEQKLLRQFGFSAGPGTFTRQLTFSSSIRCDNEAVPITAELVFGDGSYDAGPDVINFGYARVNDTTTDFVELINASRGAVSFGLSVADAGPFHFRAEGGGAGYATSIVVPAKTTAAVPVSFAPPTQGTFSSTLQVTAGTMFSKSLALTGVEGGGFIGASPSPVDFGSVPYMATAQSQATLRRLVDLHNVGRHPPGFDDAGTVELPGDGQGNLAISFTSPAAVTIAARWLDGGSWSGSALSLRPDEHALISVSVTPASLGTFTSRAKLGPARISIQGQSQSLPPCSVAVSPSGAEPLVVPLDGGTSTVTFSNIGADVCLVYEIALDPPDAWFELTGLTNSDVTVAAGESFDLNIRATALAFPDAGAALTFRYSSATMQSRSLQIVAAP